MATKIKGTAIGQRQYEDDGGEIRYSFDGDGSEAFTEQPAVLVLTGERVYTESEVNAYVNDLFKAQFDPGAFTERYREEKVVGQPWMSVVRNILQHTTTLDDAVKSVEDAERTCNLIVGVGDGKAKMVKGIEYSGHVAVPYNDKNQLPVNGTWHPVVENMV